MINRVFFLLSLLALAGCGTVATVRPLEPGERSLSFSVGGPVAAIPGVADMPVPYSVLRYRWGVMDRLEAHVGVHTTMMAFGTLGLEAGLSYLLINQKGALPAVCAGINPTVWVNPFNEGAAFFAPQAEMVLSWCLHPRFFFYTGGQTFLQLEKPYLPWAVLVGAEIRLGQSLGFTLEGKWYAPLEDSDWRVVNYPLSPADQGALGVVLGVSFYPGGTDE